MGEDVPHVVRVSQHVDEVGRCEDSHEVGQDAEGHPGGGVLLGAASRKGAGHKVARNERGKANAHVNHNGPVRRRVLPKEQVDLVAHG